MKHLRPLILEDVVWLQKVRNLPDQKMWFRQPHQLTLEDQIKWFQNRDGHHFVMVQDYNLVGYCYLRGIDPTHRDAEFGFFTFPKNIWIAKMMLQELFDYGFYDLGLHRIHSDVISGNPAHELFKRLGFRDEGINRSIYWKEGQWVDSYNIAMFLEDYEGSTYWKRKHRQETGLNPSAYKQLVGS